MPVARYNANQAARKAAQNRREANNPGGPAPATPAPIPGVNPIITGAPPSGKGTTIDQNVISATKALLPYLSPEDSKTQQTMYGFPSPSTPPAPIPTQITGNLRNTYLGQDRATQALASLESMRQSMGSPNLGPGYTFLTSAINLLKQYGGTGGNGMNRESYGQFSNAVSDLMAQAKGDKTLEPYANLANTFLNPTFSAGQLMPTTKVSGNTFSGAPSPKLFT